MYLTRGYLVRVGVGNFTTRRYFQKLSWASATFTIMADMAMGTYGGNLKMREQQTGRYADILSWMYIASATLRRFVAEGYRKEHEPFMHWVLKYSFAQIQLGFESIYNNFDRPFLKWIFKINSFFTRVNSFGSLPGDELSNKLCDIVLTDMKTRDELTAGIHIPESKETSLGRYEHALKLIVMSEGIYNTIRKAMYKKIIPKGRISTSIDVALQAKVITQNEADILRRAEEARLDAIQVDSFDTQTYASGLLENHSA